MMNGTVRSRRTARLVSLVIAAGLASALVSLGLAGAVSAQSSSDGSLWLLHIEGGVVRTSEQDNNAEDPADRYRIYSESRQFGLIDLYLQVGPDGNVSTVGTPTGRFADLSWRLEGIIGEEDEDGSGGPFSCNPPVTGEDFTGVVSGQATATEMLVEVDLVDAFEVNEEEDCGGSGYMAYATTSQYLRESLTFCGVIPLPMDQGVHTESCRKWQRTNEGGIERKNTHTWDLRLQRVNSASPTTSPSSSSSPGQTPNPNPSTPPVTPTPTPTATPTPTTHSRSSQMVLKKHLRAYGAVFLVGWGAPECVDTVPVKIQKRLGRSKDGLWTNVKTVQTNSIGIWSAKLKDAAASYRALAPEVTKGLATCKKATSKAKTHKHG